MKNYFQARKLLTHVVILGSSLAFAGACGDDDNNQPSNPPSVGDSSDRSDSSSSDKSDAGSTNEETPSAPDDAGTQEPVTGDAGTTDVSTATENTKEPVKPGECVENDEACFSCPKTPEQFLKQCSDSECEPFDNNRLGKYDPKKPLPKP